MNLQQTAGFVDAHSHLRSTSLEDQGVAVCQNLEDALLRFTAMTAVDPVDDAFVATSELVLGGITAAQVFFHTFATKQRYLEVLGQVIEGIEKSGIRSLVILGITDQAEYLPSRLIDSDLIPSFSKPKDNLSATEFAEVFEEARRLFPNTSFGLGPIAGQWCSDALLSQIAELNDGSVRIHSHLLESPRQRDWVGENPLRRLNKHGLLGPKTSLAHGVWCEDDDLALIADSGAQLVTCPGSNRVLKVGKANLENWQRHDVKFGFGLDSAAREVKAFKIATEAMSEELALQTLTSGGIACTDLAADQDQVVWDDFEEGTTRQVVIGGITRVENGKLTNQEEFDEAKQRVHLAMEQDAENRHSRHRILDALMPRYQNALDQ